MANLYATFKKCMKLSSHFLKVLALILLESCVLLSDSARWRCCAHAHVHAPLADGARLTPTAVLFFKKELYARPPARRARAAACQLHWHCHGASGMQWQCHGQFGPETALVVARRGKHGIMNIPNTYARMG